jgi:hypothetical protein
MVPDHFKYGLSAAVSRASVSSEDSPIGVIFENSGDDIRRRLTFGPRYRSLTRAAR